MQDHLISIFIDDELTLDEKIQFVQAVGDRPGFKATAVALIEQERWLRAEVVTADDLPPADRTGRRGIHLQSLLRPALAAVVVLGLLAAATLFYPGLDSGDRTVRHRFVVYRPDAEQVAIAGSFTRWEPLPLRRAGSSGYWELTLELPAGEHRFTYLLDGEQLFADPTLPTREQDDFGGQNSVLRVGIG